MKHLRKAYLLVVLALIAPKSSQALTQGVTGDFGLFAQGILLLINQFLIPLMIALCVLGFIWGVFQYFILGSDDEEKRKQGRSLMLYAIIGFVAVIALWGIVDFVIGAIGVEQRDALPGPNVQFGG